MVYQTTSLLLRSVPNPYFVGFVFFSTVCSYSFHWYLTPSSVQASPRMNWLILYRYVHSFLFIVGLVGALITGYQLLSHWQWIMLAVAIAFLYSAPKIPLPMFTWLRKIAIGKTIFLSLAWTYVTTILPLLITDVNWQDEYSCFAVSRYFLIYAICVLFDYRDREGDRAMGIRSLITWLSYSSIKILFLVSLFIFAGATVAMLEFGYDMWTIIILLVPGVITASIYRSAIRNSSDILYYFVLDGLMALSSLLMIIFRI